MIIRRILLSILGLALIAGACLIALSLIKGNKKKRPTPEKVVKTVFVDTVQNSLVPINISANGNLVSQRRLELFTEVQGVLKPGSKLFKPGQTYRQGETLLRLNSEEYYASVQSQKSNLYNQISAVMPDLRLDYPDAFPKWQAYLNSFDVNKAVPPLPAMKSEKVSFFITGKNIPASYYTVKNLEQRLGKYRITAPFNGILTEALVTEGTLVRVGQKLGEFIDVSVYELEVAISKSYADLLQVGKKVMLTTLDKEKEYEGKVVRINGNIDQASQTINAYIEVRDTSLREGVYLEANLSAREEENAIEVNRNLLQPNNQIFVVRDSILETIDVKPVYFSEKSVILKGVPEGETIVSKPIPGAYKGMLVKIYNESKSSSSNNKSPKIK